MHVEVQSCAIVILYLKHFLSPEALTICGVNNTEFTGFECPFLHLYTDEQEMRQFDDMYGADASFAQEVRPVLLVLLS